ncbi:MFS transporter [Rhodococcus sp. BP-252]|uniref:MFS transporter n=1 Tax=unclassified Rhodococcus (in: high G+C Gram-positive bacteria) TaxID=192944 RepID=UPI00143146B3|nr:MULTISPECIES: MFS transporter [unclassified Rhodococcus (in: high G+C Gram-positive bacteria)]MBY6413965.1 MFS transporter [Rhodococcus sp. BP-320]MBY6418802.1 MFS transporter [Rhodococcus sp. BP-321]MBY6423317.1 MFS transporter [Rhodococcus sp. BP-324]MBY6428837.1 MFS transporter [Rhodococcus sp. BP-323]MBY6433843.1 MFS transporter [Rhodococcus sp. BP-322]
MVNEVTDQAARLRRARAAIFGVFAVNGFVFAIWVVHIPSVEDRVGISHATLGSLLLVLGAGAIVGMQTAGPLADRFGSNRLVIATGTALSCAAMGPALSQSAVALAISLFVFGMFNGALDVSMNSQAVDVERLYGRPIMSAFHALFSVGGVVGSLVGAAMLAASVRIDASMGAAAVLGVAAIAVCSRFLLTPTEHMPTQDDTSPSTRGTKFSPRVLTLGALAFSLMLAEGVANDWSTLQVKEHLNTADGTAALAFGFFAAMMTVGRFCADRVSARFGPVAVVRYGNLIAAVGMLLVFTSGWLPLTLAGWAAFGLGLSGSIPQIFTSAGNLGSGPSATNMSRVVGMGYVGLLAGPAIIGWLSHAIPLTTAMLVPLLLTVIAAASAGTVRPQRAPVPQ